MRKYMFVTDETEGREWCNLHGFRYCGTRINSDFEYIMEYEDNEYDSVSQREEEYYLKQQSALNETWVIASDDGINSRMYRSKSKTNKNRYTFYLSEAKKCTKVEAQKIAAIMTQKSKTGRQWFALKIK